MLQVECRASPPGWTYSTLLWTGEDARRSTENATLDFLAPDFLALDLYRLHHYVFVGTVLTVASDFRDFLHDIVALNHLAENCVFAGEPVSVADSDEKLRSVRIRSRVRHCQFSSLVKTMR